MEASNNTFHPLRVITSLGTKWKARGGGLLSFFAKKKPLRLPNMAYQDATAPCGRVTVCKSVASPGRRNASKRSVCEMGHGSLYTLEADYSFFFGVADFV